MDKWEDVLEDVLDEMITYDDVQCINENSYGLFRTFNVEAERKRISNFLRAPYQDDWDD